jgi:hypothetical protein
MFHLWPTEQWVHAFWPLEQTHSWAHQSENQLWCDSTVQFPVFRHVTCYKIWGFMGMIMNNAVFWDVVLCGSLELTFWRSVITSIFRLGRISKLVTMLAVTSKLNHTARWFFLPWRWRQHSETLVVTKPAPHPRRWHSSCYLFAPHFHFLGSIVQPQYHLLCNFQNQPENSSNE